MDLPDFGPHHEGIADMDHGTGVAAKLIGNTLGMARRADLVVARIYPTSSVPDPLDALLFVESLIALTNVLDDVLRNPGKRGKQIVNLSFGLPDISNMPQMFYGVYCKSFIEADPCPTATNAHGSR
jgi:hypothetical protein